MFKPGDKVFVPFYGGGIVEGITKKEVCGVEYEYIIVAIVVDSIKLFIPKDKMDGYRIRKISDVLTMNDALKVIKEKPISIEKKWTIRYRINNKKIDDGNIYSEIEVFRDLKFLNNTSKLSQGENMILEKVGKNIASEVSLVFSIDLKAAYNILNTLEESNRSIS